ncbi:MAG: hypothetical protein R3C49_14460 [Planctomycetaceae bacterium]
MFGGVIDDFSEVPIYQNELFRIDPTFDAVRFTQIQAGGPQPSRSCLSRDGRDSSGADQSVYVFGGGVYAGFQIIAATDRFMRYDTATNTWTDLTSLDGPSGRLGAMMVSDGKDLYVFAGVQPFLSFFIMKNDLWKFDVSEQTWTQLSEGGGPAARHMAMGAVMDDRKLVVFGGEGFDLLTFGFPIVTETWSWDWSLADGLNWLTVRNAITRAQRLTAASSTFSEATLQAVVRAVDPRSTRTLPMTFTPSIRQQYVVTHQRHVTSSQSQTHRQPPSTAASTPSAASTSPNPKARSGTRRCIGLGSHTEPREVSQPDYEKVDQLWFTFRAASGSEYNSPEIGFLAISICFQQKWKTLVRSWWMACSATIRSAV